jgi:uncharacterized RmlC-like cupin family protein
MIATDTTNNSPLQQMARNRRHHSGQHSRALHLMVHGQVHMRWNRRLLLRVL